MSKIHLIQKIVSRLIVFVFTKWIEVSCQKARTKIPVQEFMLAGYQYHRADGVWSFLQVGEALRLKREPYNQYDPDAIAVYFKNDMLGFIPSSENQLLAQMMDQGESLEASIIQLLPGSKAERGVKLSVFQEVKDALPYINLMEIELESPCWNYTSHLLLRYDGPKIGQIFYNRTS